MTALLQIDDLRTHIQLKQGLVRAVDGVTLHVDAVLLDNMSPDEMRRAVAFVDGRLVTEASGGITPESAPDVAASGVDLLSSGALTHSVKALDIGLDWR